MVFYTQELNNRKAELVHRLDGKIDLVLSFNDPHRHPYIMPVGVMTNDLEDVVGFGNKSDKLSPVFWVKNMHEYIDTLLHVA